MAIIANVGCVGCEYDPKLAPTYISARVVIKERYTPEAFEQNDLSTPD